MDLKEICCEDVDWSHVVWDPIVDCDEHGNETQGSINTLNSSIS